MRKFFPLPCTLYHRTLSGVRKKCFGPIRDPMFGVAGKDRDEIVGTWHEELGKSTPRRGKVLVSWRPSVDAVLVLHRGDRVRLGNGAENTPGWIFCVARDGTEGWVHEAFLDRMGDEAVLRENYCSQELTVDPGDLLEVHRAAGAWLWGCLPGGAWGWVPEEQVTPDL